MPNRSRQKGDRREREIVALLEQIPTVQAQRIPLSGSAGGEFAGDISVRINEVDHKAEVKARAKASGWRLIKHWLGENDLLFLVEDRRKPLVVMPWETLEGLLWQLTQSP